MLFEVCCSVCSYNKFFFFDFDSPVPSNIFYGAIFSEILRIIRCTLKFEQLKPRLESLFRRMIIQGATKCFICKQIIGIVSKYSSLIRPANSFHIHPETRYIFPNSSNKFVLHLKKIIQKSKIRPKNSSLMIKKFVPYSFSKDKIRPRFVWTKFVHVVLTEFVPDSSW